MKQLSFAERVKPLTPKQRVAEALRDFGLRQKVRDERRERQNGWTKTTRERKASAAAAQLSMFQEASE